MPDRIDAVALDINSGALVYAAVGAWELGELLGLCWEDAPSDWSHTTLRARMSMHEAGFAFPYAENIQLLDGLIPIERYGELRGLAENPPAGVTEADLPLTDEEGRTAGGAVCRGEGGRCLGCGTGQDRVGRL